MTGPQHGADIDAVIREMRERSAEACGSDGRNAIDFKQRDLGIFVGGVSLLGTFI